MGSSKGKRHSAETREKMRQAALGNKNPLGYKHSPQTRERMRQAALHRSLEHREKIRQGRLGKKHSAEAIEKIRQARLQQVFPSRRTAIEQSLYAEFKKRRLEFQMHKTMFGRFQPDFVFEDARLIVQADGDYWHRQVNNVRCDRAFAKAASTAGWSVWRFGEREIQMHSSACGKAVARFVRSH